ncbi:restriction endonuclease [Frankia sp. AgB32]|nr:restriction endonuclease [Frankia sp. AgB32]
MGLPARAGLQPWPAFRPKGEEIDGSFVRCGRAYLLEAKWHGNKIPASTIYQFKGKVDGKLTGTIGVMVSMSDYSDNAVEALRSGKELNVILFGKQDIRAAAVDGIDAVLDFKLRVAAQFGDPYVPCYASSLPHRPQAIITNGGIVGWFPPEYHEDLLSLSIRQLPLVGIMQSALTVADYGLNAKGKAVKAANVARCGS